MTEVEYWKKLSRVKELNAEYAQLLEQKRRHIQLPERNGQRCRPAPLFSFPGTKMLFSGSTRDASTACLCGAGQQRSVSERAASPGHGAVQRVWDTVPMSKNGLPTVTLEVRFSHLYIQMHCSLRLYRIRCNTGYTEKKVIPS